MSAPLILFIVGAVITFLAFVFAVINMLFGIASGTDDGIAKMFLGHLGAMIAMALGSLLAVIGIVWGLFNLLSQIAK